MRRRFSQLTRFSAVTAGIFLGSGALVWAADCLGVTFSSIGTASEVAATFDVRFSVQDGGCTGGFDAGDTFAGNGQPGQIVKVSGATAANPWVTLPVDSPIDRDNIYQDATCSFEGDLIVASNDEQSGGSRLWRITAAGVHTPIVSLNGHVDFVVTLPGDALKFGPIAGRIVAGDTANGTLYAIDAGGSVVTVGTSAGDYQNYATGRAIRPASLDVIPKSRPNAANDGDFYAIDAANNRLLTASNAQFDCQCGSLLMTESASGLSVLSWDGAAFSVVAVPATASPAVTEWGAVTFADGVACRSCAGVIGNYLWKDLNSDGVRGENEPAMTEVTLTLTRADAPRYRQTIKSDASGHYQFAGLCAGTYVVTVNAPGSLTTALAGGDRSVDSNANGVSVTLATDGDSNLTIGFGFK